MSMANGVNGGRNLELWILRGLIAGLLGWNVQLALDVASIKANRFTASDWRVESRILEQRILRLPPEWVRMDLTDLKERVQRLERK